jgi:hypothetical protein
MMLRGLRTTVVEFAVRLALAAFLIGAGSLGAEAVPVSVPAGERATSILVEKSKRTLSLIRDGAVIKTYRIALGGSPIGAKRREGDSRTPEGDYRIDFKN